MSATASVLRRRSLCALFLLLCMWMPQAAFAQAEETTVRGGFLSDSLKIGNRTAFYLSARYPSTLTVLFPDSTHSFAPFEYLSREYFPTETTDGISADSAVYFLTTFEVDRVQNLRLPVYTIVDRDSTAIYSQVDTVLITQFVAQVPDTVAVAELPLKMNTAYQKVFYDFNVWMMAIILAGLLVAALLVWIVFGKKIRLYFLVKRMRKEHAHFMNAYNTFLAQLSSAHSAPATESALVVWKRYMERLESKPYTKLTTREAVTLIPEPSVSEDLGLIDKAIYGRPTAVTPSLENLRKFADHRFRKKLKEVQHG